MKFRRMWQKTAAALLLGAVLSTGLTDGSSSLNTTTLSAGEAPADLSVRKMGVGFPPKAVTAQKNRISNGAVIGPGAKYFNGGRLTLLSNQTASQMMSVILETGKGGLIVIDGGTDGDADHLVETLIQKGGHVSAWLVTHPHSDHIGALTKILNSRDGRLTIDHIYYSLADQAWYEANEAYRADTVAGFRESLKNMPGDRVHGDIAKGTEVWVDDVKITVMNGPYLFENNSINNSSVGYQVIINGVRMMFLGDMGEEAGRRLMEEHSPEELKCDIMQMTHHGQYGLPRDIYEAIDPKICLWPTPGWLWYNDNGNGHGSGPWSTPETRKWMDEIGVSLNLSIKDGDQILE